MDDTSPRTYEQIKNADEIQKILRIPCEICNRTFKVKIPSSLAVKVENFPFPIVLMHSASQDDGKREIHTMIAYLDHELHCRHVDHVSGERVFITPYIIYNPSLLQVYCVK